MLIVALLSRIVSNIAVLGIRFYQFFISPFFPPTCRFVPTCSGYCIEAIKYHGFVRGMIMGLRRIVRCHPIHFFGGGKDGYDPVPMPSKAGKDEFCECCKEDDSILMREKGS